MRKIVSILLAMCLLRAVALPAAAEEAQLYAQTGAESGYLTSLTFETEGTLSARFYTEAGEGAAAVTTLTASEGLTVSGPDDENNFSLTSENAGIYTVSCQQDEMAYCMTVTVTAPPPPPAEETNTITVTDIAAWKEAVSDQGSFDEFLADHHYIGSGDLTLVLPSGDLGSVTCGAVLPGDATVIFQGEAGTRMTGLTVTSAKFRVADIACVGDPGMPLKVMEGEKTKWNVTVPSGTTQIDGKLLEETVTPLEKAVQIEFDSGIIPLSSGGWSFSYSYHGGTDTVYVVNEGILTGRTHTFNVTKSGAYFVVEGTPPTVVTKDASTKIVTISKEQSRYLQKVSLGTGFKSVQVTDSKGNKIYATCNSDGVVTFYVKYDTADTYTIQQVSTTTTVTKTTTTSRRYTTPTQDCYLVTPAGFSNAVRAVQDGLVTLDCTQAGRKAISLPVESLAAAAQKGYSVLVKAPNAELTLDAAALKSLAQQARGTTVLLSYQSLNHKTLTAVGQASVQSHLDQHPSDCADLAFLVTAASDSETIEDLQQGTITLKIPFIVLPGTEDQENVVYALQGETVTDARETTVADGYLTTRLLDLTEHMVFQIGEPVETAEATEETTTTQPETEPVPETTQPPEPEETVKSFPVWIPVTVVLLLAGGAAAWFLYLRKRFKK
ncbi:MAG: hypothetical protein Q4F81_09560 [Eubacteriales bacterium]|nr:hypothetical protein [Eubacteriales bacterium]